SATLQTAAAVLERRYLLVIEFPRLDHIRDAVQPVAFMLDGQHAREILPVQLRKDCRPVDHTLANHRILGVGIVELNDIFQMYTEDMSLQFLQTGNRIETIPCPVTYVRTGPDILVTLDRCQYRIRRPVYVWLRMIMYGYPDAIDPRQAIDAIPLRLYRLGGKIAQPELLPEFEIFLPLIQRPPHDHAHGDNMDALGF